MHCSVGEKGENGGIVGVESNVVVGKSGCSTKYGASMKGNSKEM